MDILIYFLVLVVLTLLTKPKIKSKFDPTPTPTALRGTFVPNLIGRRRVQAHFAWAGNRFTKNEKVPGASGSGFLGLGEEPKQKVYYESAVHALATGPGWRLHRIYQGGKVLFEGPIDSNSHPSGSFIKASKKEGFYIYWGEANQPVNTFLGDASRIGISSRWPYFFYVVWAPKYLGPSPRWETMDYEIETKVFDEDIASAPAYMPPDILTPTVPTTVGDGPELTIVDNVAGPSGTNKFVCKSDPSLSGTFPTGDLTFYYPPGQLVQIGDNPADGEYVVLKSEYIPGGPNPGYTQDVMVVYIDADIPAVDTVTSPGNYMGSLGAFKYVEPGDLEPTPDGANAAHALNQILFAPAPHGCGFDKSEEFDPASFEILAELLDNERTPCSVHPTDGARAYDVVEKILDEFGVGLPLDVRQGVFRLVPMRFKEPVDLPTIPVSALLDPKLQVFRVHEDVTANRIMYAFQDRKLRFRDNTFDVDDDGNATLVNYQSATREDLEMVIDFDTAVIVGLRRSQLMLGGKAKIPPIIGREGRLLLPGTSILLPDKPYALRIVSVEPDPNSPETKLECIKDMIGAQQSTYAPSDIALLPDDLQPATFDVAFTVMEVPALWGTDEIKLFVPRIRKNSSVKGAVIWVSTDGDSYAPAFNDDAIHTGGVLTQSIAVEDQTYLETGPTFTVVDEGLDINSTLDLTSEPEAFWGNQQLVIFDNGSNDPPIAALCKITFISGNTWRLDGLIFGRWATPIVTINSGTRIYIINTDDIVTSEGLGLAPGQTVWVKSVPYTDFGTVAVESVVPKTRVLKGKGVAPQPVHNIRSPDTTQSWLAGTDLQVEWDYIPNTLPETTAGLSPAGTGVGVAPPFGTFTVRIKTTGGSLKMTYEGLTVPSLTVPIADLIAAFGGGEPASLLVEVENTANEYRQGLVTKTFNRID